ncbi:hypothetical protein STCU_02370 [Strigomonas culicis]|uniref:Uncharacterized protein n=1 Tax=Strigomonas culicis TaxID=28005 RepID=S9UWK2_9TRYP|nr:hypothetical protein STCU_02370 [Strigomonas culicis]|eukprot:EPY33258.1 hypothetical protein STCU_02370 [Strigomonas culicis]
MSGKLPSESVEYQYKPFNKCQCPYCTKRREANATKFATSQSALRHSYGKSQAGCECLCHSKRNDATYNKSHNATAFDPDYPAPVNQTALNASRGRTGGKGGKSGATLAATAPDGDAPDAMQELDRLERLLIEEHNARVRATLEAERLSGLRQTGTTGRPRELPEDMKASHNEFAPMETSDANGSGGYGYGAGNTYGSTNRQATIREAFDAAHRCPVTPPVQCTASHQLQDTLDGVREITRDPVNSDNRGRLGRIANGEREPKKVEQHPDDASANEFEFGNSLAQNVRSGYRPYGAGMVWTP